MLERCTKELYPLIETTCEGDLHAPFYTREVERIIQHILPPHFFLGEGVRQRLDQQLPLICWSAIKEPPFTLSFYMLAIFRLDAFRFFYDMLTRWLIPGKKMNAPLQFATDFRMPGISTHRYIAGQVSIKIESTLDLEQLQKHLPNIENEVRLGLRSNYEASRILEIKGLSNDKKTALIQENLVTLIKKRPHQFDYDLLSEMQHFLVLSKDDFKQERNHRMLSRIIAVHYLFKRALTFSNEAYPEQRICHCKLLRQRIAKKRAVLGIVIALSYLHENERLEARHILSAIRKLIANIALVQNSFFFKQSHSDKVCSLYVEVEKKNRSNFYTKEVALLQDSLAEEIKANIEESLNPVFMPENEETILRNIITLSDQLKYVRDLPQAIISYTDQVQKKLEFSCVLLRIVKEGASPLSRLFSLKQSKIEILFDRKKEVGSLRKKYTKEANVFRMQIPKRPYLRQDHSIDLYKAREFVAKELRELIGEFRDYNGGYMSKERELYLSLTSLLGPKMHKYGFLLENFFYSLQPTVARATLHPTTLKNFFEYFIRVKEEGIKEGQHYSFHAKERGGECYIIVAGSVKSLKKLLLRTLKEEHVHFFLQEPQLATFGLLVQGLSSAEVREVRLAIEKALEESKQTRVQFK